MVELRGVTRRVVSHGHALPETSREGGYANDERKDREAWGGKKGVAEKCSGAPMAVRTRVTAYL